MRWVLPLIFLLLVSSGNALSQDLEQSDAPAPKIAFLKSLAVPGWGHHYVDKSDWTRGQYHLAAEAALALSYVGFSIHSHNLQQNWYTYARMEAGVNIQGRGRGFRLAVGDFENLQAYNDYQERNRNWNQLYDDTPENRWNWQNQQARNNYRNLRERFETIDQQLPALLSLMVLNRVISAVSAYNRANRMNQPSSTTAMYFSPYRGMAGIVGRLKINF